MEKIFISENNIKITIFIGNNKLFYIDHNNTNVDINRYLNLLKMDEEYFNSHGEYAICYTGNGNEKTKTKKFRFGSIVLVLTLSAVLSLSRFFSLPINTTTIMIDNPAFYQTVNLSLKDIKQMIFSSQHLTEEEKKYIYNEQFFTDILPFINSNEYTRNFYRLHLTDMQIVGYGPEDPHYERDYGYYTLDTPNVLHIRDYTGLNDNNANTVAHENVHLNQDTTGYNLIIEACAEIISHEYYSNTKMDVYSDQVKLVRKLMEIIGPKPIWVYNFTGDFSLIEQEVKPYLSHDEYKDFLECLTFDYDNPDQAKFDLLNALLSKLYTMKTGNDIKNDTVMLAINWHSNSLVRNYFNQRNTESYYLDHMNMVPTSDLQTAIDNHVINITAERKTPISYEDIFNINTPNLYRIERVIDNQRNDISIIGDTNDSLKEYVSFIIVDGVKYTSEDPNARLLDLDDLYERGIININYYLVEIIPLTAEQYIDGYCPEGYEIVVNDPKKINDDFTVNANIPQRVALPSIENESYHL